MNTATGAYTGSEKDAVATILSTMRGIDRSAWVSWGCYYAGLVMAVSPMSNTDIASHSPAIGLLAAAAVTFFGTVVLIQRHMRLSLAATTFGSPQRLVTSGIFRHSRNPIYVAFLLPLASLAALSPAAAIAATLLYVVAMNRVVIAREEKELGALFGADYAAYRSSTPRWLVI